MAASAASAAAQAQASPAPALTPAPAPGAAASAVGLALLGRRVRLTLKPLAAPAAVAPAAAPAPETVEGDVFCVQADDAAAAASADGGGGGGGGHGGHGGAVVLRSQKHHTYQKADYTVVALAVVASVEDLGPGLDAPRVAVRAFSASEVEGRFKSAAQREAQRLARRGGEGVTPEDQTIFDKLNANFPDMRWQGRLIVVADRVAIQPPYQLSCVALAHDADEKEARQFATVLARVREVLIKVRADLRLAP